MTAGKARKVRDADGVEWTLVDAPETKPSGGTVSAPAITQRATAGGQCVTLTMVDSWADLPSELLVERLWEAAGIVSGLKPEVPKAYHLWFTFRGERYGLHPNLESRRTRSGAGRDEPGWVITTKDDRQVEILSGDLEAFDDLELLRARVGARMLIREGHPLPERFDALCRAVALLALEEGETVELNPEEETFTLRTPGFVAGSFFAVRIPPHCLVNASAADNAKAFLETYRRHHL